MNEREPRMRVVLPARARWNGPWVPGRVQNVSRHGLLFTANDPPPRGTYVEIAVGSMTITARAVWTGMGASGLKARNPIDFDLLRDRRASVDRRATNAEFAGTDRRGTTPDRRRREGQSRELGNLLQYVTFVLVALAVAGGMGWEVYQTIAAPASKVALAMAGQH